MSILPVNCKQLPIFVGAGIIRTREQILYYAKEPLLAAQIIGSFSEHEWGGNDPTGTRRVFYWDEATMAAYNAFGLRNCGRKAASKYLQGAIQVVQASGQLAIIGVTSLKHEDPVKVLPGLTEWALDMGADGVEINGSCPNEGPHSLLCQDVPRTGEVIAAVRQRIGNKPFLMLKVSALDKNTIERYQTSDRLATDAIDAINNCRHRSPGNPATGKPSIEVNDGYAGQSGPIIKDLALNNLRMWLEVEDPTAKRPYQVWSIGGVTTGMDIKERINQGATMVGAAQVFYRSKNPRKLIQRWSQEYEAAANPL